MESLTELYKIGRGPSSSHTIGPFRATKWFLENFPNARKMDVTLYGSLALTGKGHQTDVSILEAVDTFNKSNVFDSKITTNIKFDYKTNCDFPNTMDIVGYDKNGKLIKKVTFKSIGGGSIEIVGYPSPVDSNVYPQKNFQEIKEWCNKNNKTLIDFVKNFDPKGYEYLKEVWEMMKASVNEGLTNKTEFNFEGLRFKRKTFIIKKNLTEKNTPYDKLCKTFPNLYKKDSVFNAILYGYAVAEINSLHGRLVTAPTLGSAGIIPGILYYAHKCLNIPDEKIIECLAIAGVIGNAFKTNGSIAGATGGCQAEVGVAVSMGAAAFNYLINGHDIDCIEYAAIIGMEHHLGLTCDPVGGAVIAPCIERNGCGAMRAISSATHAILVGGSKNAIFTLDDEIKVELKTGKDLKVAYRETSKGGLAKEYRMKFKTRKS